MPHLSEHRHDAEPHQYAHSAPPLVRDSLLCASAGQRLGIASLALLVLWLTVFWALR